MGLAELILGKENPIAQWTNRNSNLLTGLGTSLLSSGMDFSAAQRGSILDQEAADKAKADATTAQQTNATRTLFQREAPDLVQLLDTGVPMSEVWNEYMRRKQPQAPKAPIKLGAGETLYDPNTYQPILTGPPDQKEAFNMEKDLASQYLGTDPVKTYQTVRNGYEKVRSASTLDSGPGDISMIFAYMKMLDPTSVVREGEFATAENAGGVGAQISNLYNRVLSGERLTPALRKQFLTSADEIYKGAVGNLSDTNSQFSGRAGAYNVDPKRFVIQPESYGAADPLGLR